MSKVVCHRLVRTGLLVLASLFSHAGAAADPLATRYYEDAVSRFQNGDPQGALIQLKNALQRDPTLLSAKILLGRSYLATGQPREAEEQLVQAQKLGADPYLTALSLARARNEVGKYKLNLEKIVPLRFPKARQPDLWVELGVARLESGDTDGARIAFGEATAIDPLHPGGRIGLARIPLQNNDFITAERIADDVLGTAPEHAGAWFIKASAAHANGRFDEAAEAYAKANEFDPQHLQAALGEAAARLEGGDAGIAAALLGALRKRYPTVATVPYLQSEALNALGQDTAAEEARETASQLVNSYATSDLALRPEDLLLFGTIAFDSSNMETAYRYFSALVDRDGSSLAGRKKLGKTLMALGKPSEARRVLSRLSANGVADAEALALLGDASVQIGDLQAAERYYRIALQDLGGGPALARRLGMAQFHSGRRGEALSTLEALVEQAEGVGKTDTKLLLGMLYLTENRLAEAEGVAKRLVTDDKNNLTASNLLAVVAIRRGRPAQGREILESILAEDDAFRPAIYNLIKLDLVEGNTVSARQALNKLLKADPNDVRALLESARFARSQGDTRTAIDQLEKIRELEPKNILAITELINLYLASGDRPTALARAIMLDRSTPNDYLAKEALARTLIANGDHADAAVVLETVSRVAGEDVTRLLHTAQLQVIAGALDDANWSLTKALGIEPENPILHFELATLHFRKSDYAAAEEQVVATLDIAPRDPAALALRADIRMAQGQTDEAITLYRQARKIAETPQLAVSLHRALLRAERPDDALEVLRDWHQRHPDVPLVMRTLAAHLVRNGDMAGAIKLHQRLADLSPRDPFAWNNLAVVLADNDIERALKAALRAQALAPDSAAILDTLGWTRVQLGDLEKGLALLREALARNGRSATIRYHLAVALQEYGNINAARRELTQALRLSSNFPEREQALARLDRLHARP